jgi:hypothetical protein
MMVDPATQDPRSERKCVAHQHQNTIYHAKKKIVHAILINKKTQLFCCLTTEHEHVREKKNKRDSLHRAINKLLMESLRCGFQQPRCLRKPKRSTHHLRMGEWATCTGLKFFC